jgi:hypothetical protein
MSHPQRRATIGCTLTILALVGSALGGFAATPAAAAGNDTVSVDFSSTTGAFQGGASGSLYGLGDKDVPSQAVLDGAHVTNISQKPPQGLQHPSGDALNVEGNFFAGAGKDLYVYVQDEYPDWAYNGGQRPGDANNDGVWDYLPILQNVVEQIATKSAHPEDYVFIPFNEPDGGNWYPNWSTQKDQFLADWTAAYNTIEDVYAEHGLGHARIGGDGDSSWQPTRVSDFLAYAKAHNELPDVNIWHELGTQNLATFRSHVEAFRSVLTSLDIPPIPVDITEYGMPRDMGVPGQLIQWLSMFEDEKVDAQTAFWNYPGNLSDNSSRNNSGNGGWWMFKWYGDLTGSTTVKLTPPRLNAVDTLQGIAAIDGSKRKATVLMGGGSNNIDLNMTGIPSAFGNSVDVVIRQDRINGAEGDSLQPPVVLSTQIPVADGSVSLTVPNNDRYSAYQVEITPHLAIHQPVAMDLVNSTEAENATLNAVCTGFKDPTVEWSHLASGSYDVGCMNNRSSSITWDVNVPRDGTYRLTILGATNQSPGKQALFVDGSLNQTVSYTADLGWDYRGTTYATLELSAGKHTLSLRPSSDGSTLLPGSDITIDRLDLYDVTDGEQGDYPSIDARLSNGATISYTDDTTAGDARLSGDAEAAYFASVVDTGYYDISTHFTTTSASAIHLTVNRREITFPATDGAGYWTSTARVFLPEGINEIAVTAPSGALVSNVTTLRGADQKATDQNTNYAKRYEAADLQLAGSATLETLPHSSNGTGGHDVEYLGLNADSTATLQRPDGFAAGDYQLVLAAANADKSAAINYNPQVISRFIDVSEAGGSTVQATVRHNYAWQSFWNYTVPMHLTTANGAVTLGNPDGWAPNINAVTLAKFVAGAPTTVASSDNGLTVAAQTQSDNPPRNGWYSSPVSLNFTTQGASRPASVEFSLDNGPWTTFTGPTPVADEGIHQVSYRAYDGYGQTDAKTLTFKIDSTAPSVSPIVDTTKRTVSFSTSDALSGVDVVEASINNGSWQPVSGAIKLGHDTTVINFRATDKAGNTSATQTLTVLGRGNPKTPLTNITAPSIMGEIQVGTTVKASTGTWKPSAKMTFAYQWIADGKAIQGADSDSLSVGADLQGTKLAIIVIASTGDQTVSARSAASVVK